MLVNLRPCYLHALIWSGNSGEVVYGATYQIEAGNELGSMRPYDFEIER